MKKHIYLIFMMITVPVVAQVQIEVDAIKPRTIAQSEAAETIIARGEIAVDADTGSLFIGDGETSGGYELNGSNYFLKTGGTLSGSITVPSITLGAGDFQITGNALKWGGLVTIDIEGASLKDAAGNSVLTFYDTNTALFGKNINMQGNAITGAFYYGSSLILSGTNAITDDGTNLLRSGVAIGSSIETDPVFTNWLATSYEGATGGVSAAQAGVIATNTLTSSLASADTNSAASKQYVLNNAGTGGGTSTKTIGGKATDWAWSGSLYAAPRTTNGVTYLEFPFDTTNLVNGVQLVGIDGIAVTQLIIRATASTGGGTIGLLSGFGTSLTTNVITIPRFTTNSIQAVTVSHVLTGTTNGLFRWGVLPTNVVGSAAGVAWVELFQARGAW